MVICAQCRHIVWDRMPNEEEVTRYYEQQYTADHQQEEIQESIREYYRSHLDELFSWGRGRREEASLLDFGCSFPTFLEEAKKAGVGRVIGVELDEAARTRGQSLGLTMLHPAEIGEVESQTVDAARFSHTLEHHIDPLAILCGVVQKLKRGAVVYLTQPSFPVLAAQTSSKGLMDAVWPEHLHFFSPISLRVLMERAGLRLVSFFTHQNADAVVSKYARELDLAYSVANLRDLECLGNDLFGRNANFPAFAGENGAAYGLKE